MADPVLDRLRAHAPEPTSSPDTDQLWAAGRRRRRRAITSLASGAVLLVALVAVAIPGIAGGPGPAVPDVADVPDGELEVPADTPTGPALVLGDEALWAAPPDQDADQAATAFLLAMDPRWGDFGGAGMDVPETATETVVTVGDVDGVPIRIHLFRRLEAPSQWYVVAVDTDDHPLVQEDGRAVLPVGPPPAGAATLTMDLAVTTDDGGTAVQVVTGPADDEVLAEATTLLDEAIGDGSVVAALVRYRDAEGRLLDARGATYAGQWADVVAADTSSGVEMSPPAVALTETSLWSADPGAEVEEAAEGFAHDVLGWEEVVVDGVEAGTPGGPTFLRIANPALETPPIELFLSPSPVRSDAWDVIGASAERPSNGAVGEVVGPDHPTSPGTVPVLLFDAEPDWVTDAGVTVIVGAGTDARQYTVSGTQVRTAGIPVVEVDLALSSHLVLYLDEQGHYVGAVGSPDWPGVHPDEIPPPGAP